MASRKHTSRYVQVRSASSIVHRSLHIVLIHARIPSPVSTLGVPRRISPAYELRGHLRCRIYHNSISRSNLTRSSVLDSYDFDDIYEELCNRRDMKVTCRDPVPYKLFSAVVATYGAQLDQVEICSCRSSRDILTAILGPRMHRMGVYNGESWSEAVFRPPTISGGTVF